MKPRLRHIVGLLIEIAFCSLAGMAQGQIAGKVTGEIPRGFVQRGGQGARLPLNLNDNVYLEDVVYTSAKGRVLIQLNDGSTLRAGAGAQMTVKWHDATSHQTEVAVLSGELRAAVVKAAGTEFKVTTPTAIIRITGNVFEVHVVSSSQTHVTSTDNDVVVSNVDPAVVGGVVLHPGQSAVVCAGKPPTTLSSWQLGFPHIAEAVCTGSQVPPPGTAVPWPCTRQETLGGGVYSVGGGVSEPIPIYRPDPPYSEEARKANLQGTVSLAIIVDVDGDVHDVHVVKPVGMGLDEKAVETVSTWKFKPAQRNGTCVPVRVLVEVTFRLPPDLNQLTENKPSKKVGTVTGEIPPAAVSDEKLITAWKVGSPYEGDIPDTTMPPDLEQRAEQMGFNITVKPFPAVGFARQFFEAVKTGQEPDILAIDNYAIIDGATTPLGNFTGIGSDEAIRRKLVRVTESLSGLEGVNRGYGFAPLYRDSGWEFLVTTSRHSKAAKLLAVRSPECRPLRNLAPLTQDLQESVIPIARAYLQGDRTTLAAYEDGERLHTDTEDPTELNVDEMKGCGYWGNERLAFVPIVSSYESPTAVGHISLLLVLRKQQTRWQLLTASTDPVSASMFVAGLPMLPKLLQKAGSPEGTPLPAKLVAPEAGQSPVPAQGQRFGDFVWQPSTSTDVVAQIIEFAYNDDARLFLRFFSGNTLPTDQLSDGLLLTTRGLWRWRVWSISDSGAISFSESRSFSH